MKKCPHVFFLILLLTKSSYAADIAPPRLNPAAFPDPVSLVGITIDDIFTQLIIPSSIAVSRGKEAWQDDVVFSYPGIELFVARNHVWQIALREYSNIKRNSDIANIKKIMGEPSSSGTNFLQYNITNTAWPMAIRFVLDKYLALENIYIYRTDF